jgi:hypothetical protein
MVGTAVGLKKADRGTRPGRLDIEAQEQVQQDLKLQRALEEAEESGKTVKQTNS